VIAYSNDRLKELCQRLNIRLTSIAIECAFDLQVHRFQTGASEYRRHHSCPEIQFTIQLASKNGKRNFICHFANQSGPISQQVRAFKISPLITEVDRFGRSYAV
jgi:hypothetical protein